MQILLLLGIAILFCYFGYRVMKMIDNFIAVSNVSEDTKTYPIAIVLGKTELANQVIALLEKNRIRVLYLTEPFLIEQEQQFTYLFALSENDADNIVLYKIGFKLYGLEKMIALCNDSRNESMFNKEKIHFLSARGVTAQMIYDTVLQAK